MADRRKDTKYQALLASWLASLLALRSFTFHRLMRTQALTDAPSDDAAADSGAWALSDAIGGAPAVIAFYFRGTRDLTDVIFDVLPGADDRGFRRSFSDMADEILATVKAIPAAATVITIGHSMGAALAAATALKLAAKTRPSFALLIASAPCTVKPIDVDNVEVVSVACPPEQDRVPHTPLGDFISGYETAPDRGRLLVEDEDCAHTTIATMLTSHAQIADFALATWTEADESSHPTSAFYDFMAHDRGEVGGISVGDFGIAAVPIVASTPRMTLLAAELNSPLGLMAWPEISALTLALAAAQRKAYDSAVAAAIEAVINKKPPEWRDKAAFIARQGGFAFGLSGVPGTTACQVTHVPGRTDPRAVSFAAARYAKVEGALPSWEDNVIESLKHSPITGSRKSAPSATFPPFSVLTAKALILRHQYMAVHNAELTGLDELLTLLQDTAAISSQSLRVQAAAQKDCTKLAAVEQVRVIDRSSSLWNALCSQVDVWRSWGFTD